MRLPLTFSPLVVKITILTLNVPFGRPRRLTVAVRRFLRKNLLWKTRTLLPFTKTFAVRILTPPGCRRWILNLRRLRHRFAEGRRARASNDGLPGTGVPTRRAPRLGGASREK